MTMSTIVFVSTIACVAFTFFVIVHGDSRHELDRCRYSPRGVRAAWKPSEEGNNFNVIFFVAPHRWGHHEEDAPLTLGLEWGDIEQPNILKKRRYTLEPPRGAAAGPGSPSQATRLPHKSLRLGWNDLPLTWQMTSGGASTLFIGNYTTEVKIGPQHEVNVTVEGMSSFLNCDRHGGGFRFYGFNSSSSVLSNQIVPFYWERNGDQYIYIAYPSLLSFSTHSGGRNLSFCKKGNETPHSWFWHLRSGCPPPLWREYGEGDPSWGIRIKGVDIDLEEEEDNLVVRGNWNFLQLHVKYTRKEGEEDEAWITTWNQRSVDVIYEDVFPSQDVENATTALPNTTATEECPVCSVFCTPFNIYLVIVDVILLVAGIGLAVGIGLFNFYQKKLILKEREGERWAERRRIEQLESDYTNYEERRVQESRL